MATNRIGFRQFLRKVNKSQDIKIIVDSNIIISYFDEIHSAHDDVSNLLDSLDSIANVTLYTTVTTKSEFLDYQRRKLLTMGLLSLNEEFKDKIKLKPDCSEVINTVKLRKNMRLGREIKRVTDESEINSALNYFRDSEIKEIKKIFRARDIQDEAGWLKICAIFLKSKLLEQEKLLDSFCNYLSVHDQSQKNLFIVNEIDWNKATIISAETGMGYSDAMILNMACSTKIEFIATLDFDLVYAGAFQMQKSILLPDNRIKTFKRILKN